MEMGVMDCSGCGKSMTRGHGFWICLECGSRIEEISHPSVLLSAVNILPHVIALPVTEYLHASRAYEKLHRLTDAAELLTRFCTAVVLADLLDRSSGHAFPEKVQEALLDRLERPTFGAWAWLLETAVKALPRKSVHIQCVVPELSVFVLDKLLPLLGGNQTPPEKGIIALRNVLAHSGRPSQAEEGLYLKNHPAWFEQLIDDAAFFAKVQVVGSPAPDKTFLLHGVPLPGTSFPEFDLAALPAGVARPQPDRLLLIAGDRAIDLFPLHAYGDVFHYLDKTREEVRTAGKAGTDPRANFEPVPEASPATLLYFRRGAKDYLEYTSLSPYAAHSQEGFAALERFRQVFQLEQWRRNAEARQGRKEFDFGDWRKELLELFVGRGEQVRRVADWAKQASTGICWISGHPGVGKSAFMADLAERFFTGDKHYCKIVHFFRGADPRCNRMKFLENALTSLWANFGKAESLDADPQKRADQFRLRLAEISREQAAEPEKQRRRIVFLLDGLDEVLQNDREFAELIFENRLAGVLWICAGRDVNELGKRMREHGAHEAFGEEGLPVLTDGDLREILDKECGRQIYELIARDRPETPPNGNSNPFLEALVERSQGLPLYLRLVVQDIREGKLSFKEGEEKRLPRGLASYYERVLERLQISDVAAVLTPVFCLLACAKAPLTIETLLELMKDDRLIREGGEELLRKSLEFGHLMLKRVTVTEQRNVGEEGEPYTAPAYVLYHESFRDHLLATNTVKYAVKAAQTSLIRLSVGWPAQTGRLFPFRYILRHGIAHLIECENWDYLASILCSLEFAESKVLAGMLHGLVEDCERSQNACPAPDLKAVRSALTLGLLGITQRPKFVLQILVNNLRWWQPISAELKKSIENAQHILDDRGPWLIAEGPLPNRTNARIVFNHAATCQCIASDFSVIVGATESGDVEVHDLVRGDPVSRRTLNARRVVAIAVDSATHRVAWLDAGGHTRAEGSLNLLLARHGERRLVWDHSVGVIGVSRDGDLVAWRPDTNQTELLASGVPAPVQVLRLRTAPPTLLCVAGNQQQTVWVLDLVTKRAPNAFCLDGPRIVDADLEPHGREIFLLTLDATVRIVDHNSGRELAQLAYEKRTDLMLRGRPSRCAYSRPTGIVFFSTDQGQVAGWDWSADSVQSLANYCSVADPRRLRLFETLPETGRLFLSTDQEGGPWGTQNLQRDATRHGGSVDSCCFTRSNQLVSLSRGAGTLRWSSVDLRPVHQVADRDILKVAEGVGQDDVVVGDDQGRVWSIEPNASPPNRGVGVPVAFSEPVISIFHEQGEQVVASGRSGRVLRIPLFSGKTSSVLAQGGGYREQQLILKAGAPGQFWSLRRESLPGGAQTVFSLVEADCREIPVLTTPSYFPDACVSEDGATVCLAGSSVQLFQRTSGGVTALFHRSVAANKVAFLRHDFLAVALAGEPWLEVWRIAEGMPICAAEHLPAPVTALTAKESVVFAGLRSGDLMSLKLKLWALSRNL